MEGRLPKPDWGLGLDKEMPQILRGSNNRRRFQKTPINVPYPQPVQFPNNSKTSEDYFGQPYAQSHSNRGQRRGGFRGRRRGHNNNFATFTQRAPTDGIIRGITKKGFSFKRSSAQDNSLEADKKCGECGKLANYKCPLCYMKYCSISCCNSHKSGTNCQPLSKESEKDLLMLKPVISRPPIKIEYSYPTQDTIKPAGLEKLLNDPLRSKMVEMLNNPRLRKQIMLLDTSDNPKSMMDYFTNDPDFSHFKTFIVENMMSELFL